MGACSKMDEGGNIVALMEKVLVVDLLVRLSNALISGWRSFCGGVRGVCFDTFICVGYLRWGEGGFRIFQVWVGVTVRSLIWYQLFQLREKFLEIILLGSSGGYFWGDDNSINGGEGFHNSGVEI